MLVCSVSRWDGLRGDRGYARGCGCSLAHVDDDYVAICEVSDDGRGHVCSLGHVHDEFILEVLRACVLAWLIDLTCGRGHFCVMLLYCAYFCRRRRRHWG